MADVDPPRSRCRCCQMGWMERAAYGFPLRTFCDCEGNSHFHSRTPVEESVRQALVEEGVDVNVALNSGANPLHIASFYGHIGAAEVTRFSRFLRNTGSCQQILAPKVEDVDAVGDHGSTSLHLASRHGSVDIAKVHLHPVYRSRQKSH